MPMLQEGGPPVSNDTIESARRDLPREYGVRVVTERGARVLIARVPRDKPDYNFELQEVALYATLADVKDTRDVLLVGDEKVVRMEPVRLRDHVREKLDEDKDVVQRLRATMPRADGAWTVHQSPGNHNHKALACRLPVARLRDAEERHFKAVKDALGEELVDVLRSVNYAYFVTDSDYGRVGRRIFVEQLAPEIAALVSAGGGRTANPVHQAYNVAGGTLTPER